MIATTSRIVTVRPAFNAEGPEIGRLAAKAGFSLPDLNWSLVSPYWLVAEHEGLLIGAIQLCPSVPIGRLELLCLDPDVRQIAKGLAAKKLLIHGCAALAKCGAQYVSGMVDDGLDSYEAILQKRGAFRQTHGALYLMKVIA